MLILEVETKVEVEGSEAGAVTSFEPFRGAFDIDVETEANRGVGSLVVLCAEVVVVEMWQDNERSQRTDAARGCRPRPSPLNCGVCQLWPFASCTTTITIANLPDT